MTWGIKFTLIFWHIRGHSTIKNSVWFLKTACVQAAKITSFLLPPHCDVPLWQIFASDRHHNNTSIPTLPYQFHSLSSIRFTFTFMQCFYPLCHYLPVATDKSRCSTKNVSFSDRGSEWGWKKSLLCKYVTVFCAENFRSEHQAILKYCKKGMSWPLQGSRLTFENSSTGATKLYRWRHQCLIW